MNPWWLNRLFLLINAYLTQWGQNLIWFHVFDLTGDSTRVLNNGILWGNKSTTDTHMTLMRFKCELVDDHSLCGQKLHAHTVCRHITIIVSSSQNRSISGQAYSMITSVLASHILTSWHTQGWPVRSEGPWGGLGGNSFTVGPARRIRGLKIKSTSEALFSLTVEYDDERDQLVTSPPHGDPPSHIEVQVHEVISKWILWFKQVG